jgi:hypothetical protein
MQDQPTIENRPTPESPTIIPTPSPDRKVAESNKQIHTAIIICSLALIGCFFLPWVNVFLGQTASGYQIQQLPSDGAKLVWTIPVGGLLALLAAAVNAKQGAALLSHLAGVLPFLALVYYCAKIGKELLQSLEIGAYLTLLFGAALLLLPCCLKKQQS